MCRSGPPARGSRENHQTSFAIIKLYWEHPRSRDLQPFRNNNTIVYWEHPRSRDLPPFRNNSNTIVYWEHPRSRDLQPFRNNKNILGTPTRDLQPFLPFRTGLASTEELSFTASSEAVFFRRPPSPDHLWIRNSRPGNLQTPGPCG